MSAILELPEVRVRVAPISVESYELVTERGLLNKRIELIRGITVDRSPRSPLHCTLSHRIYRSLLHLERSGFVVGMYAPLRLADSVPEPDVMIVRGEERDFDMKYPTSAELVLEIADGNATLERANASLYAEANVPEYWIVLAQEQRMEVYRHPVNGVYQQKRMCSANETLVCESVPGLKVALVDWFTRTKNPEDSSILAELQLPLASLRDARN